MACAECRRLSLELASAIAEVVALSRELTYRGRVGWNDSAWLWSCIVDAQMRVADARRATYEHQHETCRLYNSFLVGAHARSLGGRDANQTPPTHD